MVAQVPAAADDVAVRERLAVLRVLGRAVGGAHTAEREPALAPVQATRSAAAAAAATTVVTAAARLLAGAGLRQPRLIQQADLDAGALGRHVLHADLEVVLRQRQRHDAVGDDADAGVGGAGGAARRTATALGPPAVTAALAGAGAGLDAACHAGHQLHVHVRAVLAGEARGQRLHQRRVLEVRQHGGHRLLVAAAVGVAHGVGDSRQRQRPLGRAQVQGPAQQQRGRRLLRRQGAAGAGRLGQAQQQAQRTRHVAAQQRARRRLVLEQRPQRAHGPGSELRHVRSRRVVRPAISTGGGRVHGVGGLAASVSHGAGIRQGGRGVGTAEHAALSEECHESGEEGGGQAEARLRGPHVGHGGELCDVDRDGRGGLVLEHHRRGAAALLVPHQRADVQLARLAGQVRLTGCPGSRGAAAHRHNHAAAEAQRLAEAAQHAHGGQGAPQGRRVDGRGRCSVAAVAIIGQGGGDGSQVLLGSLRDHSAHSGRPRGRGLRGRRRPGSVAHGDTASGRLAALAGCLALAW